MIIEEKIKVKILKQQEKVKDQEQISSQDDSTIFPPLIQRN